MRPSQGSLVEFLAARQLVVLVAAHAGDDVAGLEARVRRLDHLSDRTAAHDRADLDRRQVLLHVAHPDPVRGIERQQQVAYQHLAVTWFRHRLGLEAQHVVVEGRGRATRKAPLAVLSRCLGHHASSQRYFGSISRQVGQS